MLTSFVCNRLDRIYGEANGEGKKGRKIILLLYNAFVQMMKQDEAKREIMLLAAAMSIRRIQAE